MMAVVSVDACTLGCPHLEDLAAFSVPGGGLAVVPSRLHKKALA